MVAYLLLGSETLYTVRGKAAANPAAIAHDEGPTSNWKRYLPFKHLLVQRSEKPPRLVDFVFPLRLASRPYVMIPACAYAMVFLFGVITPSIEIPQLWPSKFGSNEQQVGLQFLSMIIGSVLGEQIGGHLSDRWMWLRQRRTHKWPAPEYRLWLSYFGFGLTICGVVVFLVQTGNASARWNITPLVGVAIAAGGNQIVTTVYVTYAVDCCSGDEAAGVGVFITFVRQIWGFIGPFW